MKLNLNKKQKGFTLVEILLVVGFIALASVGVYTIYNKVTLSNQANMESRNLDTIRAGIKNLYGANSNYGSPTKISPKVVNDARITPESMRDAADATKITNIFGGNVGITAVSLTPGATDNGFEITYNGVPGGVCVKLATTGGAQFDELVIGSATVKKFGTNTLDPATAALECNKDTGDGIVMKFKSL